MALSEIAKARRTLKIDSRDAAGFRRTLANPAVTNHGRWQAMLERAEKRIAAAEAFIAAYERESESAK